VLQKALSGDLVAGGQQAIGAGLEIVAMYGGDGLGRAFEHVCGPQGTGQVKAFALEFGGHASIENMQAAEVELLEGRHRWWAWLAPPQCTPALFRGMGSVGRPAWVVCIF
jgi:hypothetical protein